MGKEAEHLSQFLEDRLPAIGLDFDLYGPYVLGLESGDDSGEISQDEIEEVVQLLRASSENEECIEDDALWDGLIQDIVSKMKLDVDDIKNKHKEEVELQKKKFDEQLEQAKKEQEEQPKKTATKPGNAIDDAAKKAMLQRFAYEEDGEDDAEDEPVQTNRDVTAAANMEKATEQKNQKVVTKKDEQLRTKEQKAKKVQAKEDRKSRTTKGERKR